MTGLPNTVALPLKDEVDAYLKQRDEAGERICAEGETRYPPPSKAELPARLEAKM